MTVASANIFPKVTFVEGSAPSSPSATDFHLYFDSSDHLLKWKNSAGTVTTIATGSGASGSITASGYTQTTARMLGRTTASTGAIEEITVGSGLSLSAGSLTATGSAATGGQVFLTSDVSMASIDTFYDGPSQSLAAGTYLVWGTCITSTAGATHHAGKLWDGSTVYHTVEHYGSTSGGVVTLTTHAYMVLGSTTTIKMSAAVHVASSAIIIGNGTNQNLTTQKSSKLSWIKIA